MDTSTYQTKSYNAIHNLDEMIAEAESYYRGYQPGETEIRLCSCARFSRPEKLDERKETSHAKFYCGGIGEVQVRNTRQGRKIFFTFRISES